jgi:phospholipase C
MSEPDRSHAIDHVIVVLFENRSLDNLLGHLYGPEDGKTFDGVLGKELSNPVPAWADHQPPDGSGSVSVYVGDNMDAPNPDSGEEYAHTNTQLFGTLDDHNRFAGGDEITAPYNAPVEGAVPTMDGFVADYISFFTWEMGRQPTHEEYSQIMQCFTPEQVPVLNGLAREFGVFDHWFCEVPSQTFMNRSFWTAATCSPLPTGGTTNEPIGHWIKDNGAETIFNRLEQHGRSWKVYVEGETGASLTGLIHWPTLHERFATHFVPFSEFEEDAASGNLPDFAMIEPNLLVGHGDFHPAAGAALVKGLDLDVDVPSSILSGDAFLQRIYDAYRSMRSADGANVWNTTLLIGWDEPGGTYDHVPPGPVPAPDKGAPAGQMDFRFDRSGYRVPAIVVSPWVEPGSVYNDEHRHTSLIATLTKLWDIGDAFTERDKAAKPIDYVFTRETPTDPDDWGVPRANPVPKWQIDWEESDRTLSNLGNAAIPGLIKTAKAKGWPLPPQLEDPNFHLTTNLGFHAQQLVFKHIWPLLGPEGEDLDQIKAIVAQDLTDATKPEK